MNALNQPKSTFNVIKAKLIGFSAILSMHSIFNSCTYLLFHMPRGFWKNKSVEMGVVHVCLYMQSRPEVFHSNTFFILQALCFSTLNLKSNNGYYIKVPNLHFILCRFIST